ncbi:hypothetical protein BKA01_000424 [Pseudonocardia eucalypti]|uniref:permease prefix domain 1-containing protein n=1 Tax=Pseudonocardia eucalypti TaxID=648755 RepID=UPI00160D87AC|nr:hypothetical protein [Pseudonocardia eucalypti]
MDTLLRRLDARLYGPRRARRELLAEVADGLADAERRYAEAGYGTEAARRAAAEEFGDPDTLVPVYQAELTASQGRRTALLLLFGLPVASRLWGLLWSVVPRQAPPTPAEVAWLYPMYQAATLVSVMGAVLGLALLVRGARRGRSPGAVVVLLGVAGALAVALNLTASVSHAIVARSPAEVIENSPLAVVIYVVTVLAMALVATAAWRSIALARRARTREWRVWL